MADSISRRHILTVGGGLVVGTAAVNALSITTNNIAQAQNTNPELKDDKVILVYQQNGTIVSITQVHTPDGQVNGKVGCVLKPNELILKLTLKALPNVSLVDISRDYIVDTSSNTLVRRYHL
ncbi:MAG: hypothetical protein V7K50_18565 [Nostoc sp.]|uniref:hypothetical protein n=1 Tax=Nostoc sp. TaxID=1180 RepID=UPI002FF9C77C